MIYTVVNTHPLMISASKSTLSLNNIKILRPKVTKNLKNLRKKSCESPPRTPKVSITTTCLNFVIFVDPRLKTYALDQGWPKCGPPKIFCGPCVKFWMHD